MAKAFAAAISDSAPLFLKIVKRGSVTRTELETLQPGLPGQIWQKEERNLYIDLLFARTLLARPSDVARRQTLELLLHAAKVYGRYPAVPDLRWLFYASMTADQRPLQLPTGDLERQQLRWKIYQANELLQYAYGTRSRNGRGPSASTTRHPARLHEPSSRLRALFLYDLSLIDGNGLTAASRRLLA